MHVAFGVFANAKIQCEESVFFAYAAELPYYERDLS